MFDNQKKFVDSPFVGFQHLLKAVKGEERAGHKYVRRVMKNGKWQYIYTDAKPREATAEKPAGITWERKIVPEEILPKVKEKFDGIRPEDVEAINKAVRAFATGEDTYKDIEVGNISKERKAIHNKVKKDYFDAAKDAKPKDGKPKVVFMAGLPASGKTSATHNIFKKVEGSKFLMEDNNGEKYVTLNPDDIKEYLPEYNNGLGAAMVHRESSKLNAGLIDKFSKMGVNVILDGTLSDPDKAKSKLEGFKSRGYKSALIHVDVDVGTSLDRAEARYKKTGRFVPYDLIASYAAPIRRTTEAIRDQFDSAQVIKND